MARVLYQPVSIQLINSSSNIIRNSKDRFDAMLEFCQKRYGGDLSQKSYLDIGSCYGYFVDAFNNYCKEVRGIESSEKEYRTCKIFYPNIADSVSNQDFTKVIKRYKKYDIVSLLSVMHSIIISESEEYATSMLKLVDEKTNNVLFFDMGEDKESIYSETMKGWNKESIREWILANTSFDYCEPLIEDGDIRFGRTLFACYREQ